MRVTITGIENSQAIFASRFPLDASCIYQNDDEAFRPIVEMYSQFETYALRVEKMFDALIQLGGEGMISYMLNMGQRVSPGLGVGFHCYRFGLQASIQVHEGMGCLSLAAAHFTDWCFQLAMDPTELGQLDFEHKEFDEFILSLREELCKAFVK